MFYLLKKIKIHVEL